MEGNNIKISAIGILLSVYLMFGCPHFLHSDRAYISLVHHFFHANIFHLAVNCVSLWTLFRQGYIYKVSLLVWAFLIASLSWFFSSVDPVGFSNIIFAIIGLRTPSIRDGWWKRSAVITFLLVTVLMAILPQVSAITHVLSFIFGCIAAGLERVFKRISSDLSRASYNQ